MYFIEPSLDLGIMAALQPPETNTCTGHYLRGSGCVKHLQWVKLLNTSANF